MKTRYLIAISRESDFAKPFWRFAMGSQGGIVLAANAEPEDEPENHPSIGIGEEVVAAANDDGFVRLARYGDWAHNTGVQRFDRRAGESIVKQFKCAFARFTGALLGSAKLPVFHGHPDVPAFAANGNDDHTRYAEIEDIDSREDGLYIKPKWNEQGQQLLSSGSRFFFSPYWAMRPVSGERQVNRPFKLLSVGLTPNPNIPGSAANSNPQEHIMKKRLIQLMTLLGFNQEQAEAAANEADGAPTTAEVEAKVQTLQAAANERETALQTAANEKARGDREASELAKARESLAAANATATSERKARAELVLDTAIAEGRVKAADREKELTELCGATDDDAFVAAANALSEREKVISTDSKTQDIAGKDKVILSAANSFREKVDEYEAKGKTSSEAWTLAKKANPDLYSSAYPTKD